MLKATNESVLRKVFEHAEAVDQYCESIGAIRVMTALFGSQNYSLATATSDVDTKSIIVPKLDDWLWSTEGDTNHVITMPDGSHAELKPVVGMFKQFIKGNINFLEMLYTPYVDIACGWEWLYNDLIQNADNIARHNMYKQSSVWFGYIDQMMTRTFRSHESQGFRTDLGYNPKAFMNVLRLKTTFIRWFEFHRPFDEAIDMGDFYDELTAVKSGSMSYEYVQTLIGDVDQWIVKMREYVHQHYTDKEVFNAEQYFRDLCLKIFHAREWRDEQCG